MKALMIGATGTTGKDLVNSLLTDTDYKEVVIFVRRLSGIVHPKLVEIITDFENLEAVAEYIKGDILFCCLGTTLKAAGSKENQTHIDYQIPATFAAIAKRNGVSIVVLLSAYGASPESRVFYSRLKGKLEAYIQQLSFDGCIIFRPGLLLRNNTDRAGERIFSRLLKLFNSLGLFTKFKPMPTAILAAKMAKAPKKAGPRNYIIELDKIFDY